MNKYQEALEFLRSEDVTAWGNDKIELLYFHLDNIEELVDKETPKKVEKSKPLEEDTKIGRCTFKKGTTFLRHCPVCGEVLHLLYHKNYCGQCGTRLDWEE